MLQQLTEYELVPEEWGGQTIVCNISAKFGQGIDNLLEMVLLTAEMADLKANPNRKAHGTVIEAKLDKAAVRLQPFWYRTAPCMQAIPLSRVPLSAAFAQ